MTEQDTTASDASALPSTTEELDTTAAVTTTEQDQTTAPVDVTTADAGGQPVLVVDVTEFSGAPSHTSCKVSHT